jgi:molybdate/tungstate transport system permease protein
MKTNKLVVLFTLLGAVLVLFIVFPLLKMTLFSDTTLLWESLKDHEVIKSIRLTMLASLYATFFCMVLGIPLAYILARYDFWGRKLIEGLVDLPIMVPHTAAGIALLTVFGKKFWVGGMFDRIGIGFIGELPGIVIGMAFVSLPFLVNAAKDGFRSVDPRLEKVARTLGAAPGRAFRDISFPLCSRHILSGAIMMWARGISEFGAVVILAYHPMVAPVLIFERFNAYGLQYSRPVAVILVLVCLSIFIILRSLANKRRT